MTELPVQRSLLDAVAVLERLRIEYMVMGGFAVRTWAIPRPTYDVDIAVAVDEKTLPLLLEALDAAGFDVPEEHRRGFRDTIAGMEKVKVTRFAEGSLWDLDLFIAQGAFFAAALPRRRRRMLEGRETTVMAPEDVIALKLLAHRRKDQLDVEEILKVTRALDLEHLREQARLLDVEARLDAFLSE